MEALKEYGLPGLIIAALVWYLLRVEKKHDEIEVERKKEREEQDKLHRSERDEWRRSMEKQAAEQNRLTRENTNVLTALKTLLENQAK